MNERETRERLISPAIATAGWDFRTQVVEEYHLSPGRIVIRGQLTSRDRPKFIDYALFIKPNIPLAVVEAKDQQHQPGDGMPQAVTYANKLHVPFAFSTNGNEFLFRDMTAKEGEAVERLITPAEFPSPEFLWARYLLWKGLATPRQEAMLAQSYYTDGNRKPLRYYQGVAVQRVVEAICSGQQRILLVMATGTGKTFTAAQIIWRLREAGAIKRVLFLVDRNILATQALMNDFKAFSAVATKIADRRVDKSYEVYVALYQAISGQEAAQDIYKQFSPGFFDLVVVDECHRGSAAEDSAWRVILDYFSSAIQIGLTATPKETITVSNIDYFGEPVYTYSLRTGIDDGFLAPFKVVRVELDRDVTGWRPTIGQTDKFGAEVPDRVYTARDFDRSIILPERDKVVARSISNYLRATDRFAKTIVFCTDIDHAERMRQALVNENADLVAENERYVVRITGDSPYGIQDLDDFIDPECRCPVIATTSKLLSTGVDAQTCKVIVLDQSIGSMTEFKQIIGRGTRLREDLGKTFFTIIDFRHATELFADPEYDGDPIKVYEPQDPEDPAEPDDRDGKRERYIVEDVSVSVLKEREQYFDKHGRLITESIRDYTRTTVLGEYASLNDFLHKWSASARKSAVIRELEERGILIEALQSEVGTDYDPFDLICHVAFDRKLQSRKVRAEGVRRSNYLSKYGEVARDVLSALLDKYADEGPGAIEDAHVLRIRPLSEFGTPMEILNAFGGRSQYEKAVEELEAQIYEAR